MMDAIKTQVELFNTIKAKLPPSLSLPENIASLLNISIDSAYRRIRGEKPVTLDELQLLCKHFQLSADQLMHLQTDGFLFFGKNIDNTNFQFSEYLEDIHNKLLLLNSFENPILYYECKDIPLFYHFHSFELAAFKYFFWMKTILQFPEYRNKKFFIEAYSSELYKQGKKIYSEYMKVPSVEIWNIETINSTINQIEFFKDTDSFTDKNEVLILYQKLDELMIDIEKMATDGKKNFPLSSVDSNKGGSFEMYFNEVIMGNNTIMFDSDKQSIVFVNHSVMNYIGTRDTVFCGYTIHHLKNMMRKSSLISSVSERERNHFFKNVRAKIYQRMAALK